jgi:hypothetical protein
LSLRDQTLIKRQLSSVGAVTGTGDGSHHHFEPDNNGSSAEEADRSSRAPNPNLMKMSQNPNDYITVSGNTYALSPYAGSGETLFFWILLVVLSVLVIANASLTFFIFGTLRLGAGMESIEVRQCERSTNILILSALGIPEYRYTLS